MDEQHQTTDRVRSDASLSLVWVAIWGIVSLLGSNVRVADTGFIGLTVGVVLYGALTLLAMFATVRGALRVLASAPARAMLARRLLPSWMLALVAIAASVLIVEYSTSDVVIASWIATMTGLTIVSLAYVLAAMMPTRRVASVASIANVVERPSSVPKVNAAPRRPRVQANETSQANAA